MAVCFAPHAAHLEYIGEVNANFERNGNLERLRVEIYELYALDQTALDVSLAGNTYRVGRMG